ncbi:hypothetical protein GGR52DRAFT_336007 [Hypoxylon sp. FL1284]|nr:hypothetical protein GGR52DRAFT_336007 [Hypoxylon sp. FL1284]
MSVFSLIKRGRAQAKEHNAKRAEKTKEDTVTLPYKHVVTHAALDALSGAPSSWRQDDRPKIMEQNRRRSVMAASRASQPAMPRVGSSLSYVSNASDYMTPVVPLPKNYSHSNLSSWREQLGGPQEGYDYFSPPRNYKGKEREYTSPLGLATPVSRSSPMQMSAVSSQGVSLSGSSGNSNSSDEELEIGNKTTNHRPENVSHPIYLSQRSSSSETSNRTPLTSSRSTFEGPAKNDRHYPPLAQSTYFSAPRPMNRRALSSDMSTTAPGRPYSTASLSESGNFSSASSVESIGLAMVPPMPPYATTPGPDRFPTEPYVTSERAHDTTAVAAASPSPLNPHVRAEQRRASVDVGSMRSGQVTTPPIVPLQKKRRRLSKSRPPTSDGSGVKMSTETIRPDRPPTATDFIAFSDFTDIGFDRVTQQKQASETVITPVPALERRTVRKLSKNPEAKPSQKPGRWPFRIGSKSSGVAAH